MKASEAKVGMKGTTSGFEATITEVCEWSRNPGGVMVVVRLERGTSCICASDFIPQGGR